MNIQDILDQERLIYEFRTQSQRANRICRKAKNVSGETLHKGQIVFVDSMHIESLYPIEDAQFKELENESALRCR